MAKYGRYGWTPAQMERINERRAARGQEELRNLYYEDRPQEERKRPSARPRPVQEEEEEENFKDKFKPKDYMKSQAEDRTKKFRERFGAKGSMAAQYGYKSSFPVKKSMIQNSLEKI